MEGFDKLHLILYQAGVILLNINMKWMITSQISSDLVKMWEKGGMQLSADGSLTPDATDWILGEQNKCADKILHIYLYDVLSMIWSSPKLSGLTILTFFLFQFWKDEIASKATDPLECWLTFTKLKSMIFDTFWLGGDFLIDLIWPFNLKARFEGLAVGRREYCAERG